jgi:hypothetical protein
MMMLNKKEKEELVLDLRSQGKTFREIVKDAKISPHDIKRILKKTEPDQSQSAQSLSFKAYELFSQGKTPIDVAIALNLTETDATQYHKEYWKLRNLDNLNQIYERNRQIGDVHIEPFVELYKSAKSVGMKPHHVVKLLAIANNDLPSVEYRCQELKREEASLQARNRNSARIFQELNNQIMLAHKTMDHLDLSCEELRLEMDRLYIQKTRLEEFLEGIRNNDKG